MESAEDAFLPVCLDYFWHHLRRGVLGKGRIESFDAVILKPHYTGFTPFQQNLAKGTGINGRGEAIGAPGGRTGQRTVEKIDACWAQMSRASRLL